MNGRKRLCVFCGSSMPPEAAYRDAAAQLGDAIGRAGMDLVYGGGRIGLMGMVAAGAVPGATQLQVLSGIR